VIKSVSSLHGLSKTKVDKLSLSPKKVGTKKKIRFK
jgi:hypothetical protein